MKVWGKKSYKTSVSKKNSKFARGTSGVEPELEDVGVGVKTELEDVGGTIRVAISIKVGLVDLPSFAVAFRIRKIGLPR
jgi:hypothetical protein